jgi:hypothetical protein
VKRKKIVKGRTNVVDVTYTVRKRGKSGWGR